MQMSMTYGDIIEDAGSRTSMKTISSLFPKKNWDILACCNLEGDNDYENWSSLGCKSHPLKLCLER